MKSEHRCHGGYLRRPLALAGILLPLRRRRCGRGGEMQPPRRKGGDVRRTAQVGGKSIRLCATKLNSLAL